MLPSALLLLTFASLPPLSSASSTPYTCSASMNIPDMIKFIPYANGFSSHSAIANLSNAEMDLTYVPKSGGGSTKNDCLQPLGCLMKTYQLNNHTSTGVREVGAGCGKSNFTFEGSNPANTTVVSNSSKTSKPDVKSSVSGTSGAALVRLSSSMMFGVAVIFVFFL